MYFKNSVLTSNKTQLHYRDQIVNAVREILAVHSENHMTAINIIKQWANYSYLMLICGTYNYHWAYLKG
jgi:hypothetical protein